MNVKTSIKEAGHFLLLTFLFAGSLLAVPGNSNSNSSNSLNGLRESLDLLKHEVANHETEIKMFEERVNNQDTAIASMRQQVQDALQANKDLLRGNASSWESKIMSIDAANKNIINDLKQLRTHANDSAEVFSRYKQRFSEIEDLMNKQNQNLENLEAAVKALSEAISLKESLSQDSEKPYRVKPGDTLEKIAKSKKTSVKILKELNGLVNDRIVVGQILDLP